MLNPAVPEGTFRRSFVKGMSSGALMMGIFSTVMLTAAFALPVIGITAIAAPTISGALTMIGLGSVATGLFSGITATQRAAESVHSASNVSHPARREPVRAPEQAVAPAMSQAIHNQRAWADRVSAQRSTTPSRVDQILADRSLSDGDRASAILRDREQSSASEGRH